MILQAEEAVRQVAPYLVGPRRLAVAGIQTTRPKYLLFDSSTSKPYCVVQFGPESELERVHVILQRLHGRVPHHVPEPLGFGPYGDSYVQIQSGLAGSPWFRVQRECSTLPQWLGLHARAMSALDTLQRVILTYEDWRRRITPAEELAAQLRECTAHTTLPDGTVRRIEGMAEALTSLGAIEGHAQHGDFSLNNLLFDTDVVRTIDFDEFGLTYMPLHDETGLALSMLAVAPPGLTTSLNEYLDAMRQSPGARTWPAEIRAHERAFVIHHVLWRINKSHGIDRRVGVKRRLIDLLCTLAQ